MKRYAKIYPIGLLLLAFALRLYRLNAQSLWWDEGISLHLATSSLADVIADRAANIHPPLYFFLLKGWVALAGTSAFSARFFSASASLLQVGGVYAVARRWLGRPTARVAAFFTALSPLSIIYAQEARVYALLPLVYLALLALTYELSRGHEKRVSHWLLLGVVEVIGLYLHYMVVFLVAYAGGWLALTLSRARRWADLRRWVLTQFLVGLASLPWVAAVLLHWPDVQARIQLGRGLVEPVPMDYLLRQVWVFHLTGLTSAGGRAGLGLFIGLTSLLLALLLLARLVRGASRRPTAWLAAHWLVPLGSALLVWSVRSFSHPRYVALYALGLTLLTAYALYPGRAREQRLSLALSSALGASLLLTALLGLRAYFFDPALGKEDVRGAARYLQAAARPGDLILIPDSDWSLPFVYQGQTPVEMPRLADEEKMWADLAQWTSHRPPLYALGYPQGTRDQRKVVPFALEKAGSLVERRDFKGLYVHHYQLDQPIAPPALAPLDVRFGPVALSGAWVEAETPADTALSLALRWRPETASGERFYLAMRLLDEDGWSLAAADDLLLNAHDRPTDHWPAGQETVTYHVLPFPSGLPPLTYTLALGLYVQTEGAPRSLDLLDEQGAPQGQRLDLAAVRLTPLLGTTNPYRVMGGPSPLSPPVDLADGLRLLGATLDRATLMPGQPLFVTLRWQAVRAPLPDLRPRLALVQDGQELTAIASAPALGRYPTSLWGLDETVLDHYRLVAPPAAADGVADVVLSLSHRDASQDNRRLVLGTVEIAAGEHLFIPPPVAHPLDVRFSEPAGSPVARLIGYDLPAGPFYAGAPITLTLYWEALSQGDALQADYAVFTHILAADGRLVGQHDGPPANGRRPSGGWLSGEIVVDLHVMTFREPDYVGQARVEVGFYDPVTGTRLITDHGSDFFYLPFDLTIR